MAGYYRSESSTCRAPATNPSPVNVVSYSQSSVAGRLSGWTPPGRVDIQMSFRHVGCYLRRGFYLPLDEDSVMIKFDWRIT